MSEDLERKYKAAGARSMAKLVEQMRDAQKDYFESKAPTEKARHLKRAKALEEQTDRAVEAVLKFTEKQ